MTALTNEVGLALLYVLEKRAKKKGHKSLIKAVARRLRATGSSHAAIGQVVALRKRKSRAPAIISLAETANGSELKRAAKVDA